MKLWKMQIIVALAALLLGPSCTDEILLVAGDGGGIVVVNSDYSDTAVSLVDRLARETARPELVTSLGSPPLLSGDVVAARNPSPTGELVLIDRANANVTFVNPATGAITHQWSVRTDSLDPSNPNPHDALVVSDTKVYVLRGGRCARTSPDPFGFCAVVASPPEAFDVEESNDIVVLDPTDGTLTDDPGFDLTSVFGAAGTGDIDTASGHVARPSQFLRIGELVGVVMLNLDIGQGGGGGPGLIALIDPLTDSFVDATPAGSPGSTDSIVLSTMGGDCEAPGGSLRSASVVLYPAPAIYLSCSGFFPDLVGDHAGQLAGSRVVKVDLSPLFATSPGDVVVTEILNIDDIYPATPSTMAASLSGVIQVVSPTLGFVSTLGAFPCFETPTCSGDPTAPPGFTNLPARIYSFDPSTPGSFNAAPLLERDAFALEGLFADPFTLTLYATSNVFMGESVIHVFDYDPTVSGDMAAAATEDTAAAFTPNSRPGMGPRELAFY